VSERDEEARLIQRAKSDAQAFGQLYERYVKRIYSYVYYRTGNEGDAEDLTARVFQRAIMHLPSYREKGLPFSAWLYRIAHNLVANWHRDQARRQVVPLDDYITYSLPGEAPELLAAGAEERRRLLAAVGRLPADRQTLIILKFVDCMSNAEIGQVMGRSEGAIKGLYHRTLLALRAELARSETSANGRRPEAGRVPQIHNGSD